MNIPLLKQVKQAILDEPKRLEMSEYFRLSKTSPCGTTACIAGHAIMADRLNWEGKTFEDKEFIKSVFWVSDLYRVPRKAQQLLNISVDERYRLFHHQDWPTKFREQFQKAKNAAQRARVTAKRIDHFIATKGCE